MRGQLVPAPRVEISFTRLNSSVAATGLGGTVALLPQLTPAHRPHYFSRPCGTQKPADTLPGVETPGYFREVPPGLECAAKTLNFRTALGLNPNFKLAVGP